MSVMHINQIDASQRGSKSICGLDVYNSVTGSTLHITHYMNDNGYSPKQYKHTGFCPKCEERVDLALLAITDLE